MPRQFKQVVRVANGFAAEGGTHFTKDCDFVDLLEWHARNEMRAAVEQMKQIDIELEMRRRWKRADDASQTRCAENKLKVFDKGMPSPRVKKRAMKKAAKKRLAKYWKAKKGGNDGERDGEGQEREME